MHFIRPHWLTHAGDKKSCEVYSVHVSPDSERLATGGLDGNVRIWSTKAIFKSMEPSGEQLPKQLCSLSHHSGAVLAVRFSGNNRYLASGSDDKIVLVYERDMNAQGRPIFGTGDSHTEVWRTHRRLAGHDNDVQDLSWSADSSVLVSVGLDSKVVVWSGSTFERLKRIDLHQSHVKGITFDPANKYFATASDDRSVKIFRFNSPPSNATAHDQAGNFSLETSIVNPFRESPLTTYFRRCSWSPDGSHIAAANAVNGPVSSVAIINRGSWESEINLIGHEGPVEVCAFAPRMFSKDPIGPEGQQNPVTVIACAGQDKALSLWNTSNPRPLVITQDIATKAISDLAWSPDGRSLFAASLDGSIICLVFEEGDLGFVLAAEENERILQKFGAGRKGTTLPEGTDSIRLEELSKAGERKELEGRMGQLMMDGTNGTTSEDTPMANAGIPGPQWQMQQPIEPEPQAKDNSKLLEQQRVTITKDGKKRVKPLLVSTGGGHRSNLPNAQLLQTANASSTGGNSDPKTILDLSRPYDGLPKGGMQSLIIGNKRKVVEAEEGDENQTASTTNGKRIAIHSAPDAKTVIETPEFIRAAVISPALAVSQTRLGPPRVRTIVNRVIDTSGNPSANVPSALNPNGSAGQSSSSSPTVSDTVFEARNSQQPTRLTISKNGQALWIDFLPRCVLLVTGNSNFWCAACEDGSIHVYTPVGRRLLNPLVIEAQPCFLDCKDWYLMVISAVGMVHVWNLNPLRAVHPPVSVAPILDIANTLPKEVPSRAESILEAGMNSQGNVIISLTNGDGYTYSRDLCVWQRLSEAWWAVSSQYWDTSARAVPGGSGTEPSVSAGVIAHLERRTTTEVLLHGRGRMLQRITKTAQAREGFEGFETAVSLGHLENRMAAAIALNAREEYRSYLLIYAKRIAIEGMKGKVEELLRDLMGPLDDTEETEAEVCGMKKRTLLEAVLKAIGKNRDLQRITVPYASILGMVGPADEEDQTMANEDETL
ncbi:TUP1-like enhancer of split-domain-containing protein [Geopyxis carbonaria]|nr:TUP1-like enhancer of split-domain-containing protein [Geopyxis carbonaria]